MKDTALFEVPETVPTMSVILLEFSIQRWAMFEQDASPADGGSGGGVGGGDGGSGGGNGGGNGGGGEASPQVKDTKKYVE